MIIGELKATASFGVIKDTFVWADIPDFAVITGENGCGKTQLLRQIAGLDDKKIFSDTKKEEVIYRHADGMCVKHSFYRGSADEERDFLQDIQKMRDPQDYRHHFIIEYLENGKESYDTTKILERYEFWLKRNGLTLRDLIKKPYDDIERKIKSINDKNYKSEPSIFNEQLFVNIVGNYLDRYEEIERKLKKQDKSMSFEEAEQRIVKEIGQNPIDKINQLLQTYNYDKFKIFSKRSRSGEVIPYCEDKEGNEISFNFLSTGERIIVSLILWQYDRTALKPMLILLDEPDAFLNPKISRMLIDILKNTIVKEYKCQVIITTHSLSSVAQCEDQDLFFMQDGRVFPSTKEDCINRLADGVITFSSALGKMEFLSSSKKPILVVEGKTDKVLIEEFYKNNKEQEVPFEIIDGAGADNLPQFFNCFNIIGLEQKRAFLFDYDQKGIKNFKDIEKKIKNQNSPLSNVLYVKSFEEMSIFERHTKVFTIEKLFPFSKVQEFFSKNELQKINNGRYYCDIPDEKYESFKQHYDSQEIQPDLFEIKDEASSKIRCAEQIIRQCSKDELENFEKLIENIEKSLGISRSL